VSAQTEAKGVREMSQLQLAPTIGATIVYEGIEYRVYDVPCYGTIILESMDGQYYYRLQGQGWKVAD